MDPNSSYTMTFMLMVNYFDEPFNRLGHTKCAPFDSTTFDQYNRNLERCINFDILTRVNAG